MQKSTITNLSAKEKHDLNVKLAAVVATLADFPQGSPETTLYLGTGSNLTEWEMLKTLLLIADLITVKGNWVKIAPEGVILAQKLKAFEKKEV